MAPKFKVNTVICANRSGSLAIIKKVDFVNELYEYSYINPSSPQYAGIHSHGFKDIETFWSEAKNQNRTQVPSSNLCMEIELTQMCNHVWVDYFGLNEKFKYCKHCDEKKT